jgi:hypothetical protein
MFTRRAHSAPWSGLRRLASLPQVALGVKLVKTKEFGQRLPFVLSSGVTDPWPGSASGHAGCRLGGLFSEAFRTLDAKGWPDSLEGK